MSTLNGCCDLGLFAKYPGIGDYFVRVFTICVQLGCGLWATTWSAFFNEKQVDEWAYGIFAVYVALAIWILCNIGWETWTCFQPEPLPQATWFPIGINCSYNISSVLTAWTLVTVRIYNMNVVGHHPSKPVANLPLAIFIPTLLGMRLFFPSKFWLVPCGTFVPWIDLGCGFTITIWTAFFNDKPVDVGAYLIFGVYCYFALWLICYHIWDIRTSLKTGMKIKDVSIHSSVIFSAVGTTVFFCVVCFYNGVVLKHDNMATPVFKDALLLFLFEHMVLPIFSLAPASVPRGSNINDVEMEEARMESVPILR
ncbi:hypothetical protein Ocin01_19486, partial [Orchesella cincta]